MLCLGPFYLLLPQPLVILYFWSYCNRKFIRPSAALSLECTKAIDAINDKLTALNQETPLTYFDSDVYRQPSLVEPFLKPEAYRNKSIGQHAPPLRHMSSDDVSSPGTTAEMQQQKTTTRQEAIDEEGGEGGGEWGSAGGSIGVGSIRDSRGRGLSLQRSGSRGTEDSSSPPPPPSPSQDLEEREGGYGGGGGGGGGDSSGKWSSQQSGTGAGAGAGGGWLRSVREVDESMVEDDIDLLLGSGLGARAGEGEDDNEDDNEDGDSQFEKVQCNTVQCSTIQYSTVQYNIVQHSTAQEGGGEVFVSLRFVMIEWSITLLYCLLVADFDFCCCCCTVSPFEVAVMCHILLLTYMLFIALSHSICVHLLSCMSTSHLTSSHFISLFYLSLSSSSLSSSSSSSASSSPLLQLSDRRSTYHSYGTTDRTFISNNPPRRSNSSHMNEAQEERRRRESK